MKIMGALRLISVGVGPDADAEMRALVALRAELEAADWRAAEDVRLDYPRARITAAGVVIDVTLDCSARLLVNYRAGVILIEGVDSAANARTGRTRGKGKAS
ncbi:hypothetical protein [Phenylobacterium sp. Root700]|uniref:hypothetical protein n=1 Tax=Phenylobacterium sp. Root700 TaxID=1736591 RepID=UPI0006F39BA1|nr:hypothetical protein [Phenylobacterium sp. Root700]KRB42050.1 hypothetical protein ASE02_04360 [Phenylobacterium sp. Root700]